MRNARFRCVGLILSVLLFSVIAQAQDVTTVPVAQAHNSNWRNRPPKLPALTGQTREPEVSDAASGYTYGVLYNFCSVLVGDNCVDGTEPHAGLIQDAAGNLYGTTENGGANDDGTVFKVDSTGHETVLYSFCTGGFPCPDGSEPEAALVQDTAGNLYGITSAGGGPNFDGTVFKLDTTGHETVLYSFCSATSCTDGRVPTGTLIRDAGGNLFGTTQFGGAKGLGTVFKLDSTGNYTVLYSFCPTGTCTDGENPKAGVIEDAAGNLYGTASGGGANLFYGAVFKLDTTGNETVLHSFCSTTNSSGACTDGSGPEAGLIQDTAGNLYGTTPQGGANAGVSSGQGTVFKIDSTGHETVLYSFCSAGNCADGTAPTAGVIRDAAGNLFGTTSLGGTNNNSSGTVFKLDTTGHETVLYNFCSAANCTDGTFPFAGLIQDAAGNLYGATVNGGATSSSTGGTVFKLTAATGTPQTITFPTPGPYTYGVGSVTLIAAASSGLPVSFAVTAENPANIGTVSVDTLTITGAGSITVQATQPGNSTYAAAPAVSDVITVLPAPLTVTAESGSVDFGWPIPILTGTLTGVVSGDGITASYTTTAVEGSPAGPYPITPKLNDPNGRLPNYTVTSTNGTLTIGPQATSVPLILSLSGSATAGGGSFTLIVNGANFASKAVVLWNGAVRTTVPVSSTQLQATILAADIAAAGTNLVTVANPSPDAATGAAQPFVVQ